MGRTRRRRTSESPRGAQGELTESQPTSRSLFARPETIWDKLVRRDPIAAVDGLVFRVRHLARRVVSTAHACGPLHRSLSAWPNSGRAEAARPGHVCGAI